MRLINLSIKLMPDHREQQRFLQPSSSRAVVKLDLLCDIFVPVFTYWPCLRILTFLFILNPDVRKIILNKSEVQRIREMATLFKMAKLCSEGSAGKYFQISCPKKISICHKEILIYKIKDGGIHSKC